MASQLANPTARAVALRTLKQVMEEKVTVDNVEVATVNAADGFVVKTKEQVDAVIERL